LIIREFQTVKTNLFIAGRYRYLSKYDRAGCYHGHWLSRDMWIY